MSNENAACLPGTGRWARPRALAVAISGIVVALTLGAATNAAAQMGENAITTKVDITEGDTITRFCALGDACGDDGALSGPMEGVWRDEPFVEPGERFFQNLRLGKVISAEGFDVYCAAEDGSERCARIGVDVEVDEEESCLPLLNIVDIADDCPSGSDYKVAYDKAGATDLTVCKNSSVVAACIPQGDPLVENGAITAFRALFDYDCVRYCYGGCCRR